MYKIIVVQEILFFEVGTYRTKGSSGGEINMEEREKSKRTRINLSVRNYRVSV